MPWWLSNLTVCEYYEGKTKTFDVEKVKDKFAHRVRWESCVIVCIIEYENRAIGFIQFYQTEPDEYCESKVIDMNKYTNPYGMELTLSLVNRIFGIRA